MMSAKVLRPNPMLADNAKTIEFLIERAGGDREKIAEIKEWGAKREKRIERLCRFAGLLEKNGILYGTDRDMSRIEFEFAFQHCVAIASKHGLDLGYTFNDSESGPLASDLTIDLYAARPNRSAETLFENPQDEADFLQAVAGRSPDVLAEVARLLVIPETHRMIILPQSRSKITNPARNLWRYCGPGKCGKVSSSSQWQGVFALGRMAKAIVFTNERRTYA